MNAEFCCKKFLSTYFGAFTNFRKAKITFFQVCPSVRLEHFRPLRTDIYNILYLSIFL